MINFYIKAGKGGAKEVLEVGQGMGRTGKEGLSPKLFSRCGIVSESIDSGVNQAKGASCWKDSEGDQ